MAAYTEILTSFDLKGLYQSSALKQRPGMLLVHLQGFVEQSLGCYSAGNPT